MGSCLTSRPPLGNGKDTNGRGNGEASSTTDRPEGSWGVSRVVLQTPYRETSQQKVRNVKGGEIMYHLGGRALRCGV